MHKDHTPTTIYEKVSKATFKNFAAVRESEIAACLYCKTTMNVEEICEYIVENVEEKTALCPKCGIDVIVPDVSGFPITDVMWLEDVHLHFYPRKSD